MADARHKDFWQEVDAQVNGHSENGHEQDSTVFVATHKHLTDLGNAERLVERHGHNIRYCHQWKKWFVWDGKRWSVDNSGIVRRLARETVRSIYSEAENATTEAERKAIAKWAMSSESKGRIESMIDLAEAEEGIPITPDVFDSDPWKLNVLNGTVDLKTGELLEHNRADLITKLAPVEYDYADLLTATHWRQTLEKVLPNEAVRCFFQKLVGYALVGDVSEHVLPVLYGTGANGKSTVLNGLQAAVGDYGMQSAPDLLIAKHRNHPTELADLFGMRFVASIEVEDGSRLAESLVKQLTGGDRIKARRMREDFWEFNPTHTVFMAVNHKPQVRGTDNAIWRRIRLIPFTETIPPKEQDKELPHKLEGELSGILAWAVEGCLDWQREGLEAPDEVRKATGQYKAEMDVLGAFLRDCCKRAENEYAFSGELWPAWRTWCLASGEDVGTQTRLAQRLKERGFVNQRDSKSGRMVWCGLSLYPNWRDRAGIPEGFEGSLKGSLKGSNAPFAGNSEDTEGFEGKNDINASGNPRVEVMSKKPSDPSDPSVEHLGSVDIEERMEGLLDDLDGGEA